MRAHKKSIWNIIKRIRVKRRKKQIDIRPRYITEENENIKKEDQQKKENKKIAQKKEDNGSMITFKHQITEFELKLRYLNLRDMEDIEYGNLFPPIRSKFIVFDQEEREFSVIRAGRNQISGDLRSFYRVNDIKPGDIIEIGYDQDETSKDGKHILHLKPIKS